MDIRSRLEALAASPKPWLVRTHLTNGVRELRTLNEGAARNHAERESRKIGRDLISHDTGETVRVLSVTVEYAPQ